MYVTRIRSVNGKTAIDDEGRALVIAGDNDVEAGSLQYTDGTVIYGNRSNYRGGGMVEGSRSAGILWLAKRQDGGQTLKCLDNSGEFQELIDFDYSPLYYLVCRSDIKNQAVYANIHNQVYNLLTGEKLGQQRHFGDDFSIGDEGELYLLESGTSTRTRTVKIDEKVKSVPFLFLSVRGKGDSCIETSDNPKILNLSECWADLTLKDYLNVYTVYKNLEHEVNTYDGSEMEISCNEMDRYATDNNYFIYRRESSLSRPSSGKLYNNGTVFFRYRSTAYQQGCLALAYKMEEIKEKMREEVDEAYPPNEEDEERKRIRAELFKKIDSYEFWGFYELTGCREVESTTADGALWSESYAAAFDTGRSFYGLNEQFGVALFSWLPQTKSYEIIAGKYAPKADEGGIVEMPLLPNAEKKITWFPSTVPHREAHVMFPKLKSNDTEEFYYYPGAANGNARDVDTGKPAPARDWLDNIVPGYSKTWKFYLHHRESGTRQPLSVPFDCGIRAIYDTDETRVGGVAIPRIDGANGIVLDIYPSEHGILVIAGYTWWDILYLINGGKVQELDRSYRAGYTHSVFRLGSFDDLETVVENINMILEEGG